MGSWGEQQCEVLAVEPGTSINILRGNRAGLDVVAGFEPARPA
ncbi:MAG TPA: hypothetical protein VIM08_04510 [Arthrobacter sp.]|jgi:hypothetical protein